MEIVWTKRALERVKEVGDYISEDSPTRALNFVDKMIESIERLKDFPFSGNPVRQYPEFRHEVYEGYQIIYHAHDRIEVVTVVSPGRVLRIEELSESQDSDDK
jgi:toxin ParE1/3/4